MRQYNAPTGARGFLIDNASILRLILLVLSGGLVVGGSLQFRSFPVLGGTAIFVGVVLEIGIAWLYKLEIEEIQHEVEAAKNSIENTQTEVESTKGEVDDAQDEIRTAQREISETKDEINGVKDDLYDRFGRYSGRDPLETRIDGIESEVNDLRDDVEDIENSLTGGRF